MDVNGKRVLTKRQGDDMIKIEDDVNTARPVAPQQIGVSETPGLNVKKNPGSFGERARSCHESDGSCFLWVFT